MNKEITIKEVFNGQPFEVSVAYAIELNENIQLMRCRVEPKEHQLPHWLGTREFRFRSSIYKGIYTPLLTDDQPRNLNTILFMDKVYKAVMHVEQLKTN